MEASQTIFHSTVLTGGSQSFGQQPSTPSRQPSYPIHLPHTRCFCQICLQSPVPIAPPPPTRIVHPNEYQLQSVEALKEVYKFLPNFPIEDLNVCEMFFIQEATLIGMINAKIKLKEKTNNLEVRKTLEEKRTKLVKLLEDHTNMQSQYMKSASDFRAGHSVLKDAALIVTNDGSKQILTESQLSKVLAKRKNDPFWLEYSYISLMIPSTDPNPTVERINFKRTAETNHNLEATRQKIADLIDASAEEAFKGPVQYSSKPTPISEESATNRKTRKFNSQSVGSPAEEQVSKLTLSSLTMTQSQGFKTFFKHGSLKRPLSSLADELIAYLQVYKHVVVLNCELQFTYDLWNCVYLTGVNNYIAAKLRPDECRMVHRRYEPLEQLGIVQMEKQSAVFHAKQKHLLIGKVCKMLKECLDAKCINIARPLTSDKTQRNKTSSPSRSPSKPSSPLRSKSPGQLSSPDSKSRSPLSKPGSPLSKPGSPQGRNAWKKSVQQLVPDPLLGTLNLLVANFEILIDDFFQSPNWRNDISRWMGQIKLTIEKGLEGDNGARVIRRFLNSQN